MEPRRSKRVVALGLSSAVWPGLGQLYLKRYALGVVLATVNLALLVALVTRVLFGAAERTAPGASLVELARAGFGQRSVGVLVLALGVTWACGWLEIVLWPPRES